MNTIIRSVSATILNTTASGTQSTVRITADEGYDFDGFCVVQRAGANKMDIGLRDKTNIYLDAAPFEIYTPGNADIEKRFFPVPIRGNNNTVTITMITQEVFTADNKFTFVFRLHKTNPDCNI